MRIRRPILASFLLFVISGCASICELADKAAIEPWPVNVRRQAEMNSTDRVFRLHDAECDASEDLAPIVDAGESALFKAEYSLAIEQYDCGLQLARLRGDLAYLARFRYLIARARVFSGDNHGALADAKESLDIARRTRNRLVEAEALKVIGAVHQSKGEYAESLKLLREALQIAQEIGDRLSEAKTRNTLGQVYGFLGRHEEALTNYKKALAGFRTIGDRRGEGIMLHNLGVVYAQLGDDRRALLNYSEALAIRKELNDPQLQQETLQNTGALYMQHGCYTAALQNYKRSLAVTKQIGHPLEEARTRHNLGTVYYKLGRFEQALQSFQAALALQSTVLAPELLWRIWHGLSTTYAQLSRRNTAIFLGKQAVNTLQTMRTGLVSLDPVLQNSFMEDKARVYKDLASLLIDDGRLAEAQYVLGLLKEREFLEYIRAETPVVKSTQLEFSPKENWAADDVVQWVALAKKRAELLARSSKDLTVDEKEWLKQVISLMDTAYNDFIGGLARFEAEYRQTERDVERRIPEEIKSLMSFQGTLRDLGGDIVCIHYLSTTDKLRIIVTVGTIEDMQPFYRDSHIGERELNQLIFEYRQTLQNAGTDPLPQARKLYDYLIRPIEKDLKTAGAKVLLVYLDGALRYLPLAALHDGQTYIAERYGVVIYTAAMKDKLLPRPQEAWQVAGMGVSEAFGNFSALPAVEEELDRIVREISEDPVGVLPGVRYMNGEFSMDTLSKVLNEKKYQVVHLASHFHFSPGTVEKSFLLLGGGEQLKLQELRSVKFPLNRVDLLTLSACETGLGGTATLANKDGHEIEGFGALAQEQGAKAVMATLWKVADRSTGQFMQQFYTLRETNKLSKVEALRQVQKMFIRGAATSLEHQQQQSRGTVVSHKEQKEHYSHPYYWAPFILMGNWQ